MSEHGVLIAIEGGDGSGKATQAKVLADRMRQEGIDVYEASFPRYGQPSARYVERYLNGAYGESWEVHPDLASTAYALDRFAESTHVRAHLQKKNSCVIIDRYVGSNLAHQGTKLSDPAKRHAFYDEIMQLEYEILGIPKPSLNIVLLVPSAIAQNNVDQKDARSYTTMKRDIHEADANHLELAKANYEELCRLYPKEFIAVECMKDETTMRSREEIQQDIWKRVKPLIN